MRKPWNDADIKLGIMTQDEGLKTWLQNLQGILREHIRIPETSSNLTSKGDIQMSKYNLQFNYDISRSIFKILTDFHLLKGTLCRFFH